MKKSSLLLATAIIVSAGLKDAKAYDFNDKIYGKANVNFSYTIQPYMDDTIRGATETGHAFALGGGFNVFYKVIDSIHPFAGAELLFRIPLNGYNDALSYREFMMFHFKFGAKINASKEISVLPYYIIGFNVAQIKTTVGALTATETKASLSTGLGADVLYKDKYSVGFEWRYSRYKENSTEAFAANNVSFKFGYHFL